MVERRIDKVMKRDGTVVDFDQEKITLAIYKAAETGRSIALPLPSDPSLRARKHGVG